MPRRSIWKDLEQARLGMLAARAASPARPGAIGKEERRMDVLRWRAAGGSLILSMSGDTGGTAVEVRGLCPGVRGRLRIHPDLLRHVGQTLTAAARGRSARRVGGADAGGQHVLSPALFAQALRRPDFEVTTNRRGQQVVVQARDLGLRQRAQGDHDEQHPAPAIAQRGAELRRAGGHGGNRLAATQPRKRTTTRR